MSDAFPARARIIFPTNPNSYPSGKEEWSTEIGLPNYGNPSLEELRNTLFNIGTLFQNVPTLNDAIYEVGKIKRSHNAPRNITEGDVIELTVSSMHVTYSFQLQESGWLFFANRTIGMG